MNFHITHNATMVMPQFQNGISKIWTSLEIPDTWIYNLYIRAPYRM
jgi:hypothetical protein